jgi:hypothetical protein
LKVTAPIFALVEKLPVVKHMSVVRRNVAPL